MGLSAPVMPITLPTIETLTGEESCSEIEEADWQVDGADRELLLELADLHVGFLLPTSMARAFISGLTAKVRGMEYEDGQLKENLKKAKEQIKQKVTHR